MKRRMRKISKSAADNRLNLYLSVVLLLGAAVCVRLALLQVYQSDYYTALASSQHLVAKELLPERGRIFAWEKKEDGKSHYALAANRDLARVYVVPPEIEDAVAAAEVFYALFDEERFRNAVNKSLDSDEFFRAPAGDGISPEEAEERRRFREVKFELEMKNRKEAAVNGYLSKLEKKFDPYESIAARVEDETWQKLAALELPGVYHVMEKHRYYPDKEIGSHLVGFVGYDADEQSGRYGLEGFFDQELAGVKGMVKGERSAGRGDLIISGQEYSRPVNGSDLYLTINRSIQYFACQKLAEGVMAYGADSGSVVVIEPDTGAIIAMCSYPGYDPNAYGEAEDISRYNNPAIFDAYEPGSIFKPFTMAAGLDRGAVTPQTKYTDKGFVMVQGWPKPIKNSDYETFGGHGLVGMSEVLSSSLNTGAIFVMEKTGPETFAEYVKSFGFGEKTGIELQTEGISNIASLKRNAIRPVEAATASFGQGITATPLQLAAAYGAIANGGILMKPYLVERIVAPDGEEHVTAPRQIRRVIQEKTAYMLAGLLVNVVDGGHAKLAAVKGYYVAGKTGTAQVSEQGRRGYSESDTIHSFAGFAPVEEPRFAMMVKLDRPKNARFSASTAAPIFSEIAGFILSYLQVPKER